MLASTSAINAHYGKYSCKYTKNMLMHYFVAIIFYLYVYCLFNLAANCCRANPKSRTCGCG